MERLKKIGEIVPKTSNQITESPMGIGMEKLDRDAFDPEKVYDKVANLGVKWVRLQSGWQKTEKQEGVYDFSWLDSQVDNLLERGLKPWLCLCYGNVLYDDLAKQYYGAVGCPPIRTERMYNAWLKYVEETVKHFKGRIDYYEIWNEADGKWTWRPEASAKEYSEFCVKTGRVIKNSDPDAKVITGSHYQDSMEFFNSEFANGIMEVSDAITYHPYTCDESNSIRRIEAFKALSKFYGKELEIIQGESGFQSKNGGGGAFCGVRTNQDMQTKYLIRHIVAEVFAGVKFTSTFSSVDMAENLNAEAGKPITICGYFGLLGANFDSNTGTLVGDYYEKPSYYAFQNLCSLFCENVKPKEIPALFRPKASNLVNGFDCPTKDLLYGAVSKQNGSMAFAYWNSTDMVTFQGYEGTVTLELGGIKGDIRLVDPMSGFIYEIKDDIMKDKGNGLYAFEHLPVKDYPLILTIGDFFS